MVCSNYMNFIQQRHAAGQKCKYFSPAANVYSRRPAFRSDTCEWSGSGLNNSEKNSHTAARAGADSPERLTHSNIGDLLDSLSGHSQQPEPIITIAFMSSLQQRVLTREENNMWPCRTVQLWSAFWLRGEEVWFVTTISGWHQSSCIPRWLMVQKEHQSGARNGGSK